jgi:hypothetical protein
LSCRLDGLDWFWFCGRGIDQLRLGVVAGEIDRLRHALQAELVEELHHMASEIMQALGGEETLSPQRRKLVDLLTRATLLLDSADQWLFSQQSIVQEDSRSLLPAIRERQSIAEHALAASDSPACRLFSDSSLAEWAGQVSLIVRPIRAIWGPSPNPSLSMGCGAYNAERYTVPECYWVDLVWVENPARKIDNHVRSIVAPRARATGPGCR